MLLYRRLFYFVLRVVNVNADNTVFIYNKGVCAPLKENANKAIKESYRRKCSAVLRGLPEVIWQ